MTHDLEVALVIPRLLRRLDYADVGKRAFVDPTAQTRCWLCDGVPPARKFRTAAHVVAEALGNRRWLTREECDDCNHLTGKHESDLVTSTTPYRVTSPHRRRSVTLLDPITKARIRTLDGKRNVLVTETSSALPTIEERSDRELAVRVPVSSYKPLSICKSLARLALLLCADLRNPYMHVREWIRGDRTLASQVLFIAETSSGEVFQPTLFVFRHEEARAADANVATLLMYEGLAYWYALPKDENPVTRTFLDGSLLRQLPELRWRATYLTEESRKRAHTAELMLVHSGRTPKVDEV